MKNILNLLIFLIGINCISAQQYPRVTIETEIFTSIFDESYQQPVMVKYTVFCNPESPTYERDGISFKSYPGLKASSSSDYKDNVYDKGHMAPANTFACKKDWLVQTFSYANCALQHQGLNRGTWAALERFERNLAGVYDDIQVHIEIFFSDKWTTNSDPARIPSNFVKTISYQEENGKWKTLSFDFPNEDTTGKSFWEFQIK